MSPVGPLRSTRLEWLALGLLTAVELILFRQYVHTYVAPFYPVYHDQLPMLQWTYLAAGVARTHPAELPAWLFSKESLDHGQYFKGVLLPVLTSTLVGLLGIGRFAATLANFSAFAVGQGAVYWYLRRRFGVGCGLLGVGLFLLAGTHYYWAGGLNDLRRDYVGMVGMGLSFMTVTTYLARGTPGLALPALALGLAAASRTVLLVYWTLALAAAWLLLTARGLLWSPNPRLDGWARRSGRLLVLTVTIAGLMIVFDLGRFWRYYVGFRLATGETAARFRQFGADTLSRQLLYYPASLWQHAGSILPVAFVLAVALVPLGLVQARLWRRADPAGGSPPGAVPGLLGHLGLFLLVAACAIAILTWYEPSPLPIGCLVIPLVLVLAHGAGALSRAAVGGRLALVGLVALALGLGRFASEMQSPTRPPHPTVANTANAATVAHLQAALYDRIPDLRTSEPPPGPDGPVVTWLLVHDGLNKWVFDLLSLERGLRPATARHNQLPVNEDVPRDDLLLAVALSDALVVPLRLEPVPKGGFEYSGNSSVRRSLDALEAVLRSHHELVASGPVVRPAGVAGVWIRKVAHRPTRPAGDAPAWLEGRIKFAD